MATNAAATPGSSPQAGGADSKERATEAANRVFNTTELIEMILLNLPAVDIFATQRVSRAFNETIEGSTKIRQVMFLVDEQATKTVDAEEEANELDCPIFRPDTAQDDERIRPPQSPPPSRNPLMGGSWLFIPSERRRTECINITTNMDFGDLNQSGFALDQPIFQSFDAHISERSSELDSPCVRKLQLKKYKSHDSGSWRKMLVFQPPLDATFEVTFQWLSDQGVSQTFKGGARMGEVLDWLDSRYPVVS